MSIIVLYLNKSGTEELNLIWNRFAITQKLIPCGWRVEVEAKEGFTLFSDN